MIDTAPRRTAFFISDGTGITAETMGHSLLTQFPQHGVRKVRLPFVDTPDKARACLHQIDEAHRRDGARPILFSTLVNPDSIATLKQSDALFVDLFDQFISALEIELQTPATHAVGRFHGIGEGQHYQKRIEAINYAMAHDDGVTADNGLSEADLILIGVSRSGKTPTSLYLAMQFGLKAANYPLIPEDFERNRLPGVLERHRGKLFGLTISPQRLSQIRQERRPNSHYASPANCLYEIGAAQKLMRRENIPWIDSTARSIEEISATIMLAINPENGPA